MSTGSKQKYTARLTATDGTTPIGSCTLASGACTVTISTLLPGAHSIVARYLGGASYATSASTASSVTIVQVTTTSTLTVSGAAAYGAPVTLAVRVDPSTATGTVSFSDGTTPLFMAIVNAHWELAAYLIEQGADVNANGRGITPLHQLVVAEETDFLHCGQ